MEEEKIVNVKKGNKTITVVVAIIALLIGFGCGFLISKTFDSKDNNDKKESNSKETNQFDEQYIEKSNKAAFIDISDAYISAVRTKVNEGKDLRLFSTDTLYMIPVGNDQTKSCVSVEYGKSPFSDTWNYAYVGVVYDGSGYDYYFIGEDGTKHGIGLIDNKSLSKEGKERIYSSYSDENAKNSNIDLNGSNILKKYYNLKTNSILNVDDLREDVLLKNILCSNTSINDSTKNIKNIVFVSECKYL